MTEPSDREWMYGVAVQMSIETPVRPLHVPSTGKRGIGRGPLRPEPTAFKIRTEYPRRSSVDAHPRDGGGSVYRASGWTHVGTTQGRGRNDRDKLYDKPKKDRTMTGCGPEAPATTPQSRESPSAAAVAHREPGESRTAI